MKFFRSSVLAFFAAFVLAVSAFAADPSGSWKWTTSAPNGESFDQTLKLQLKDGVLTGTISSPRGDMPIGDATFTADTVKFTVTHERNGHKRVVTYQGKVEGDSIKGTVEMVGRDGENHSRDWTAKRASS